MITDLTRTLLVVDLAVHLMTIGRDDEKDRIYRAGCYRIMLDAAKGDFASASAFPKLDLIRRLTELTGVEDIINNVYQGKYDSKLESKQ